jgi:acyl carrier protein
MNGTAPQPEEIVSTLGHHLEQEILGGRVSIEADQNLLLDGAVDSLGMLKLVAFIEANYAVKVPPESFTIENFRSLRVIAGYVSRLIG